MADEPGAPQQQPQTQPEPPPLPAPASPPPKRRRDWGDEPDPRQRAERDEDQRDEFDDEFDDDRPQRDGRRRRRERAYFDQEPRSKGILGLSIAGIAMLSFCPFLSLPMSVTAWIMANSELRAMDAGEVDDESRGLTKSGKICGIIGFCLGLFILVGQMLYIATIFGVMALRR